MFSNLFRIRELLPNAIRGAKHLWQHEPVRLLYIGGLLANAAYEQLSDGLSPETIVLSLVVTALGELGRNTVTSPATADPAHVD